MHTHTCVIPGVTQKQRVTTETKIKLILRSFVPGQLQQLEPVSPADHVTVIL